MEAGNEVYIGGAGDFEDWYGRGESLPKRGELDEYGLPKAVDFTFHIDETIEGLAQALVSTDRYERGSELQSEPVRNIVAVFMQLCEYYDEQFAGNASSSYIQQGIRMAQE